MTDSIYVDQIVEVVQQLNEEKQRRVLDYARTLTSPKGVSGKAFLERTEHLKIDPEDLKLMQEAIEEDCERIDPEDDIEFPA